MREGGKKTFKKKTIEPIFVKVNEGDEIKKNGHISGKGNSVGSYVTYNTFVRFVC